MYICIAPVAVCGILTCRQWPERGDTTFTPVSQCKISDYSSRVSHETNLNGKSVQVLHEAGEIVGESCVNNASTHTLASSPSQQHHCLVEVSICQPPLVSNWARGCWGARVADTGTKALCLYNQSPQVQGTTWLITALMECNALETILAPGVWQALCLSQWP